MGEGRLQRRVRAFAPGRTELAGNHTDHQRGQVIAATIAEGIEFEIVGWIDDRIEVDSVGFKPFSIDLDCLVPRADEKGMPAALVRGMASGLASAGLAVRGFKARASSTLPVGGGLSSSAAFELACGAAMALFFAGHPVPPLELARMGQAAECDWFGKPCGLMDQLAIANGGIVEIDFASAESPVAQTIDFDFAAAGYDVCLVDVGCDHSRFTAAYARIPADMRAVAALCGADVLGAVPEDAFMAHFDEVRATLGDRAALRGLHFYRETMLTARRAAALRDGSIDEFLRATTLSGASSAQYLQNVSCDVDVQPAMVALALAERLLDGRGACRIHGGGFGGSIQAFVPCDVRDAFVQGMEGHLGAGCCRMLAIGGRGAEASWI